jgi:hypothetical protein
VLYTIKVNLNVFIDVCFTAPRSNSVDRLVKMPLCTLHLLSLHKTTPNPLSTFLSTLKSSNIRPLVISRVVRWIILPSHISTEHLLARNISWDIFLVLPNTSPLAPDLAKVIEHHWSITAGIPSRLIQDFTKKNAKLLHPEASSVPKLSKGTKRVASSSQNLELSEDLDQWIVSSPPVQLACSISWHSNQA